MEGFPPAGHVCPQPCTERSPFTGRVPLRAHRGARALKNAKAPCSRARRPQLHSAVVPSTRLCALNSGRRCPHSRAPCPQAQRRYPHLRAVGLYWAWRDPDTTNGTLENAQTGPNSGPDVVTCTRKTSHPRAICLQPRMQWSPPQGCVPSTAHALVPTHRQCALMPTERDSHSRGKNHQLHTNGSSRLYAALNCTPRVPHLWAVHHQPRMEWSSPQGCSPSTLMKVVNTRGLHALYWAQ